MKKLLLLATFIVTALPALAQSPSLVGTWVLTGADKLLPNGKQVPDYGTDPHGIAIFTSDGRYAIEIFRSDRKKFASNDRAAGTPEEYKDAILSTSAHFGHYTVDAQKGTITFKVDRASFPNWDDTTRVSTYTLKGDTLTWHTPPRPDGSIPVTILKRTHP
ncbi:MAG TPA: lipocalin-like domain-containing protein [Edaphobacter sp.]|nr:lipocalin-like domain-containing protein [Edaphobacter sp.]